jgi:hypothetical protein
MQSNYATALDAGAAQLPQVQLIVVLSVPVLLLALPLDRHARVRVTFRHDGGQRQLLRHETRDRQPRPARLVRSFPRLHRAPVGPSPAASPCARIFCP